MRCQGYFGDLSERARGKIWALNEVIYTHLFGVLKQRFTVSLRTQLSYRYLHTYICKTGVHNVIGVV